MKDENENSMKNTVIKRKQPSWIWYPGDFELFLGQKVHAGRFQRDMTITPLWKVNSPQTNVLFQKQFILTKPQIIRVYGDGLITVEVDCRGNWYYGFENGISLSAGEHCIFISVFNADMKIQCSPAEREMPFSKP